jgi:hypothetical protein
MKYILDSNVALSFRKSIRIRPFVCARERSLACMSYWPPTFFPSKSRTP